MAVTLQKVYLSMQSRKAALILNTESEYLNAGDVKIS